ncbi:MDR/zinc-dependent alcohol dehydrogenase-like family protein [Halovulum marinum]|nr:zinc-binding dehydrogenase [Halovulum marinum]
MAPGKVVVKRIAPADPAAGEVRIRLEGCGVCASNLGPWSGPDWMSFPLAPGALGHEGWGRVETCGAGVTGFAPGDRVAHLGTHGFATHETVAADRALKLPPELDDMPFPAEPLGCAMNVFARSDIRPDQDVAVIGIGFLGALLVRLAAQAGARVIAISRRDSSLALARQMGAAETIRMDDHCRIIDAVAALTGGAFCARVIEAVGAQWPLDLAAELVCEGGRLVIAGYHQDGPRQVNMQLWNWRGFDVANAHERDPGVQMRGLREAVAAVVGGRIDPRPLFTHVYPLQGLGAALDATRDKPGGFVKALIRCS